MNKFSFKASSFAMDAEYSLINYDGFYKEITLPYHEMLDLKNYFMNTFEPRGYCFTLYDKSERGDDQLTIGFRLEKKEEEPWEYTI